MIYILEKGAVVRQLVDNKRKKSLGSFEEDVLLAIGSLQSNSEAYGANIRDVLEDNKEASVSVGALYATLDRLERKGFINSWESPPTSERGGRARRYFKVNNSGVAALRQAETRRRKMRNEWAFETSLRSAT